VTSSSRGPSAIGQPTLYDQDFYLWLQNTINHLQTGQMSQLDWANLIEELESMGRAEKQALQSNLQVVLNHLLKYQFQPEQRSNSWRFTLLEHRDRLEVALEYSPNLCPYLSDSLNCCYTKARKKAATEMGLPLDTFPPELPFTLEEILNPNYLPE